MGLFDDFSEEYLKIGKDGLTEKNARAIQTSLRCTEFIAIKKTDGMKSGDVLKNLKTGECIILGDECDSPQKSDITTFEFKYIYPIEGLFYK